jgi:hypothetical protein
MMQAVEKPFICEMCGKKLAKGMGIELPQDMIARVELEEELVEDPACLRFCSKRCQGRWGALKQGAVWNEHGPGCMCAACFR